MARYPKSDELVLVSIESVELFDVLDTHIKFCFKIRIMDKGISGENITTEYSFLICKPSDVSVSHIGEQIFPACGVNIHGNWSEKDFVGKKMLVRFSDMDVEGKTYFFASTYLRP